MSLTVLRLKSDTIKQRYTQYRRVHPWSALSRLIKCLPLFPNRDLLKQFTTMELMRWASLVEDYGKELREGSPDSPATDVFACTEEGEKRWKDLKNRVVEHVSQTGFDFSRMPGGLT